MRWRRSTPARTGGDGLTAGDVERVYGDLLGRAPSAAEVAHQLANAPDLPGLLHAVFVSDEHRAHAAASAEQLPHVVNVWHEDLAGYGHAPGTWSPDGVAVVGRDGWVFLGTGTNAVLEQYQGDFPLPGDWLERWREVAGTRREGAARLGAAYAALVVPDKLAVLAAHFPVALPAGVRSPAARLGADPGLGIDYPVAELRGVAGGAYLRTDTHLTYAGNAALARVVLDRLGIGTDAGPGTVPTGAPLVSYCTSGDLGSRFRPPIVEVVTTASTFGDAVVVEDNREAIAAVGGHIGSLRVLRNERAADKRTVVVFGDSYAFPAPHYQGVAWFLAQAFREVHTVWVPFGWDGGYAERVGAQVVVCQAAERFVVRPPAVAVDALALAQETLAR